MIRESLGTFLSCPYLFSGLFEGLNLVFMLHLGHVLPVKLSADVKYVLLSLRLPSDLVKTSSAL